MNSATSIVRVYDVTDPAAPALAGSLTTTTGTLVANANGVGAVAWGKITPGATTTANLYAMATNRGIQAFTVTVTPDVSPPAILSNPVSRSIFERGLAVFSVSASGTPPLTYQWFKDEVAIPASNASTLTIKPVMAESGGSYTCRVTNAANLPAVSSAAVLTVVPSVNTTGLTECWHLSPGSRPYLTEGNFERGMSYHPAAGRLYLAARSPVASVKVLNGLDGADMGELNMTDVTGGTFPLNMTGVDGSGVIYACNLSNTDNGSGFRLYQWPNDMVDTIPARVYDGNPVSLRIGDSLAVRGSGAGTLIAAGSNPVVASTQNHFVIFKADEAGFFQAFPVTVEGAPSGAFGLTIAFGEGNTVWGKGPGGGLTVASFTVETNGDPPMTTISSTGTLLGSFSTVAIPAAGGAIAVDAVNGCLAHIHTGDSDNVRLYRLPMPLPDPVPATLELLDQEFFSTDNVNSNATGALAFGGNKLFALNTNNGLSCYTIAKPAPVLRPEIGDVALSGGNVVFKLKGTVGKTYLIERSTELNPSASWTPDGTVLQVGVEETVTRSVPADTPRLYFRARLQ